VLPGAVLPGAVLPGAVLPGAVLPGNGGTAARVNAAMARPPTLLPRVRVGYALCCLGAWVPVCLALLYARRPAAWVPGCLGACLYVSEYSLTHAAPYMLVNTNYLTAPLSLSE
jgi:hypothetical protein